MADPAEALTTLSAPSAADFAAVEARAAAALDALLRAAASPLEVQHAPRRPDEFLGEDQIVVVIDDGYSELYDQSATVGEFDFHGLTDDPDASVDRLDSHGSWVAQTLLGVAPEADIVHFKVFPDSGGSALIGDIEQALEAALALDAEPEIEIAAVNLSLGFGNATGETGTRLSDEVLALLEAGIVPVAAAGNSGTVYPEGVSVIAASPGAVGVSATDAGGAFAAFSQRDPELTDIAAPGTDILYQTLSGQTGRVDGTSFSAPYVSGSVARLQEAADETLGAPLSPEAVLELLQLSGAPVAAAEPAEGYRIADAEAALELFLDDPYAWADTGLA